MTTQSSIAVESPRWLSIPASLILILVFGKMDSSFGYGLSFSILYLLPVSLVALTVGTTAGLLVSIVSAVTGVIADVTAGHHFSIAILPLWDGAVRLTFFVIVAILTGQREILLARTLAQVKSLKGLLPMCASCKSIRDEKGQWVRLEQYILTRTEAGITHGVCPDCMRKLYPEYPQP